MVKVDTLVLFLILGVMLQFFTTENVCHRLIIYGLYYVEVGSFYDHVLKSFNHKWVLNFVKSPFCMIVSLLVRNVPKQDKFPINFNPCLQLIRELEECLCCTDG